MEITMPEAPMSEWQQHKAQVLARLKRAEGQVRGVIQAVEREDDCERVAQQLSAARSALDRAFYEIMACMTQRELAEAGVTSKKARDRLEHMSQLLARYG
jgi:DNA-binding FrmR family transcriptional regulator